MAPNCTPVRRGLESTYFNAIMTESDTPVWMHYVLPFAAQFGVRGLTVYYREPLAPSDLATPEELADLCQVYADISRHSDGPTIAHWCFSIQRESPMNEIKEHVRGLLLLFERLGDFGLSPFTDGQVRYVVPDTKPYDWSVLPSHLSEWRSWLEKFELLRTEHDLFEYVDNADDVQLRELVTLRDKLDTSGDELAKWCEQTNVKGNSAKHEAFQAEWLFLLGDFARLRIDDP